MVTALHAESKDSAWTECSGRVGSVLRSKKSPAAVALLPGILDKIPVMLFAGDQDVICNYVGQEKLLEKLKWQGATGMGVRFSCYGLKKDVSRLLVERRDAPVGGERGSSWVVANGAKHELRQGGYCFGGEVVDSRSLGVQGLTHARLGPSARRA